MYGICNVLHCIHIIIIHSQLILVGKENYRGKIVDDGFGAQTYDVDADLDSDPLPEPANAAYYHK